MKPDEKNKKLLDRLIAKVNCTFGSHIISLKNCSLQEFELSFYSNIRLYRICDCSFTPLVQYHILDNGTDTIYLNGTLQSWNIANQIEKPKLSVTNILEYLKVVLSTLSLCNQKYSIVVSIEDIDFYQMPSNELFEKIESVIKPPVVSLRNQQFTVLICLLVGNKLYDSLVTINTLGQIEITDKNEILDNIPVDELVWD
ncbi:MAG TPA: hypothetical protein PLH91_02105 [Tenuifilaceae bacterium]|nr:hypothetical protein [Tenuifilaceae bacterium]HOZ15011.1 hypothetical protein [Tenuifilaceae bacterium]HPI43999.1 hypothetical protein [Tenuifilaceae bacterium]HPN21305.1 hypothetical protein [Tenuifilaceae bacterium]